MEVHRLLNILQQSVKRANALRKLISASIARHEENISLTSLDGLIEALKTYILAPEKFGARQLDELQDELQDLRRTLALPTLSAKSSERSEIDNLWRGLWNLSLGIRIGLSQDQAETIEDLIPAQKVAAFAFGFLDDKLVVIEPPVELNKDDESRVEAAREALIEYGLALLSDLANSNSSPRLRRTLQTVQDKLETEKPIIQLGMATRSLGDVAKSEQNELPSDLFSLLIAHVKNLHSYLAQFPDWQDFVQQSLAIEMSPGDLLSLISTANSVAGFLEENPHFAAEEVPAALRTAAAWAEGIDTRDGRIILALGRTLENFWSLVSHALIAVGSEVKKQTINLAAKSIITFTIGSSAAFFYAISGLPGAEWIVATIDTIKAAVLIH